MVMEHGHLHLILSTANMEYLLVVDGVQENLVAAGTASGDWSCTPITDYWSYANREWAVGSGNVTNTYGTCGVCVLQYQVVQILQLRIIMLQLQLMIAPVYILQY